MGEDITLRLPVPESRSQIQTGPAETQGEGRKGGLLRPCLLILPGYPTTPSSDFPGNQPVGCHAGAETDPGGLTAHGQWAAGGAAVQMDTRHGGPGACSCSQFSKG